MRALFVLTLAAAACDHAPVAPPGPSAADVAAALAQLTAAPAEARAELAIAAAARLCGADCACLRDPGVACPGASGDPAFDRLDQAARYLAGAVARTPAPRRAELTTALETVSFPVAALDQPLPTASLALRPIKPGGEVVVIGADGSTRVDAMPVYVIGPDGLRRVTVAPAPPPPLPAPVVAARGEAAKDWADAPVLERKQRYAEGADKGLEEDLGGEPSDTSYLYLSELDLDRPAAKLATAWRVTEAEFGAARTDTEPLIAIAPGAPVTAAVWALADRGGALALVSGGVPAELAARFTHPRAMPPAPAFVVTLAGRQLTVTRTDPPAIAWSGDRDPVALAKVIAAVPMPADATVELYIRDATAADLLRALDPIAARNPRFIRIAAPLSN